MKKINLILIMTLVSIATCWMGTADRLPQQVPENQAFTIDTLIDVTGAVSEENQMKWAIDSQDTKYTGVIFDTNSEGNLSAAAKVLSADQVADLVALANSWATTYGAAATDYLKYDNSTGTAYLLELNAPDDVYNTLHLDQADFGSQTIGHYIGELLADSTLDYASQSGKILGSIHDSKLHPGEEIAIQAWTDTIRSNGGKISLNKNIDFDSGDKGKGLYNLEAEKVMTYASTEGAHLVGSEDWSLDVAGNWEKTAESIRCVFADPGVTVLPAFCNVVKAHSDLVNLNTGQVSTKGSSRSVAATGDVPAALYYQVAVSPHPDSGSGFADGTVKTLLGGSIMEAHGKNQDTSATNNWKDADSVTGGIRTFQKTFGYESGITGPGDEDNGQVSITPTPTPTQGTGTIDITLSALSAGNLVGGFSTYLWVLSGPTSQTGYGSTTITNAIAGYYTIQFYNTNDLNNPVKTESKTLVAGGRVEFSYLYTQ